jgi:DNA-binding CsgD family transcriptional regulator
MDEVSYKYLLQFNKILENHNCNVDENDYIKFEFNKQLLLKIAQVENSSLAVYDTNKKYYTLLCSKYDKTIGYQLNHNYHIGPNHFYQYMHPEDFPFILDTVIKTFNFLDQLPAEEKTDYKLIVDYRLMNKAGNYLRFVQQVVVLELDKNGEIWLILKLFDLVSEKAKNEPSQRKLLNLKTGKLYLFNDNNYISSTLLTKREVEILGLISQGLDSKNISDRLFISVNTVNNHRQNILSKTKSTNTSQALLYAKRIGIL